MINQVGVGVCFAPGVEMAPVCKQRRSSMSDANSSHEAAVRQPRLCAISGGLGSSCMQRVSSL